MKIIVIQIMNIQKCVKQALSEFPKMCTSENGTRWRGFRVRYENVRHFALFFSTMNIKLLNIILKFIKQLINGTNLDQPVTALSAVPVFGK